jgi:2-haloacid dehalogenase
MQTVTRRRLLMNSSAILTVGNSTPTRGKAQIKGVAFDAFTIFDPRSIAMEAEQMIPGRGTELTTAWRTRQFEYCWLRTLNRNYVDFWQVTSEALAFACESTRIRLAPEARMRLMNAHLRLQPWADSVDALTQMRRAGLRLAYVSNFTQRMMATISDAAGVSRLFERQLSTDAVRAFKPDPRAYAMAEDAFQLPRENILFAAFGGWDAAGAKSYGLETFWVNRTDAPLEELGVTPDATGGSLAELAQFALSRSGD